VDDAFLVAGSDDCAKMLGLDPAQFKTEQFAKVFGGISLLDGQKAWATVYGVCACVCVCLRVCACVCLRVCVCVCV
jgi:hypothetical protein